MLNFEKVRICSGCRQPVSAAANVFEANAGRSNATYQNRQPSGLKKAAKIVLPLLFLIGIGAGAFFGYPQYAAWAEERRKIETAQKENEEIDKFKSLKFTADVESYGDAYLKLPTRFRVLPPDMDTLNKFPFAEKVIGIAKTQKSEGYIQPTIDLTTGEQNGGSFVKYTPGQHARMIKVSRLINYTYSKNEQRQLVADVYFVGVFQTITENPTEVCNYQTTECNTSYLYEGTGVIQLVRTNDNWEIVSVKGRVPTSRTNVGWIKQSGAAEDSNPPKLMVPYIEDNKIKPLSKDPGDTYRE